MPTARVIALPGARLPPRGQVGRFFPQSAWEQLAVEQAGAGSLRLAGGREIRVVGFEPDDYRQLDLFADPEPAQPAADGRALA